MTEKRSQTKIEQRHNWQECHARGWTYMGIYWLVGAFIGVWWRYLPFPPLSAQDYNQDQVNKWYLTASAVTLGVQPFILIRFGSFGRKFHWFPVVIFGLMNGIFETVMFLASYDAGRMLAKDVLGLSTPAEVTTFAFSTFSIYSAMIHAKFWVPHGFPRNELPDAKPFHTHMLPFLTLISMSWLELYEMTGRGDVMFLCILHGITDALGAAKMCMASPFESDFRMCTNIAIERDKAVRMGQESIKTKNKRLIDTVLHIQAKRKGISPEQQPTESLPLIGVTCSTCLECYAIVKELCSTRQFRVRAMYRTPGTRAEERLKSLLRETEATYPELLHLRPGTNLNSPTIMTEAFAGCDAVVLYVTANESKAGKFTSHGRDPIGGRVLIMRQVLAIDAAMKSNPSIKQGIFLCFPTDKVHGIVATAPEAPWWVQQRLRLSDFLREQGHNITCIHRPAYYYNMHRVDYTLKAEIRGETQMSKAVIKEDCMPGIMEPDFVVNWVDVRDEMMKE